MANIIVLGAGMVGSAMAIDLAGKHKVTVADISEAALTRVSQKASTANCLLQTTHCDLLNEAALKKLISSFDLVICAVPGFMGFKTLQRILEAGKNVIDISFFPEESDELDALAKKMKVTAIVDCGVAPGIDNLILGYYNERMKITDFECLVGGLPKVKKWPFNYKAPFSPADVIEEYTRPARYVEGGRVVIREALSDVELVHFEKAGTLESFNSDGLRSIIKTMPHIPNMKEKTLRFPGHTEYVRVLRDTGFFSQEKMKIGSAEISPLEMTSKLLFKEWKLQEEEEEFTVMRITLEGQESKGKNQRVVFELYDEYDPVTKTSSMARTTGYTCTGAANMFLEGLFPHHGVFPPELVGKHEGAYNYIFAYLKERGVVITKH